MYNASLCMKLYKSTGTLALLHAEKQYMYVYMYVYYYNYEKLVIMWTCIVMHIDIHVYLLLAC